jgi:hypothetical protein
MKTTSPSNRSFGWTLAGAFTLSALINPWTLLPALLIGLLTLIREQWLTPFNRAWMKLGELMARVVNPLVLGIIFFAVFTPTGILMRLFGRDALNRQWNPALNSYWVQRDAVGPSATRFENMF